VRSTLDEYELPRANPRNAGSPCGPHNYHLMPASPAIDAGNSSLVPADALDVDHDGNFIEPVPFDRDFRPRQVLIPSDSFTGVGPLPIVDMGCYELQPR